MKISATKNKNDLEVLVGNIHMRRKSNITPFYLGECNLIPSIFDVRHSQHSITVCITQDIFRATFTHGEV